ncbi:CARDB domain-containing protein [Halorussus caseinilyticus]|uniref:CARDB domain-containing protein n=1 Tax=Halorussus caseinilyticus TaxID=3034025 RepID=A0ABD5WHP3_9EURY
MASVSSSHLILFIASLIIAASVAGTFTQGVQRLSSALGDRSIDVSGDIRTDISIISDPGSGAVYNESENNVTVLVKNTGSRSLPAESDRIDVLIDGQYQATATVTVLTARRGASATSPKSSFPRRWPRTKTIALRLSSTTTRRC